MAGERRNKHLEDNRRELYNACCCLYSNGTLSHEGIQIIVNTVGLEERARVDKRVFCSDFQKNRTCLFTWFIST